MSELERVKDAVITQIIQAEKHRVLPQEVEKQVSETLGVPRQTARQAVNELVEEGELTFTYRDPFDYLEIPPFTGHHAARPMEVVLDANGDPWLCDADVDPASDLATQNCWPCGELAFTRND